MSKDIDIKCWNCAYWRAPLKEGRRELGSCRRRSPRLYRENFSVMGEHQPDAEWPRTSAEHWCGDHSRLVSPEEAKLASLVDSITAMAKAASGLMQEQASLIRAINAANETKHRTH